MTAVILIMMYLSTEMLPQLTWLVLLSVVWLAGQGLLKETGQINSGLLLHTLITEKIKPKPDGKEFKIMPQLFINLLVCQFLTQENVNQSVVMKFEENKIDGLAIKLMPKDEIERIGLTAVGVYYKLKCFCQILNKEEPVHKNQRTKRKKLLQEALKIIKNDHEETEPEADIPNLTKGQKKPKSGSTENASNADQKRGRPNSDTRCATIGIRLKDKKFKAGFKQMSSAFGDKNVISLHVPQDTSYEDLLDFITSKLFPDGINPVVGNISQFNCSVVNTANLHINAQGQKNFKLRTYIQDHMVGKGGMLRLHLLLQWLDDDDDDDDIARDVAQTHSPHSQYVNNECQTDSMEYEIPNQLTQDDFNFNLLPTDANMLEGDANSFQPFFITSTPVTTADSRNTAVSHWGLEQEVEYEVTVPQSNFLVTSHPQTCTSAQSQGQSTPASEQANQVPNLSPETTNMPNIQVVNTDKSEDRHQPNQGLGEIIQAPQVPDATNKGTSTVQIATDDSIKDTYQLVHFQDLSEIIQHLSHALEVSKDCKKNIINVIRNDVLSGTYRGLLRESWNSKRGISARFAGEPGMDGGGLSREYLRLAVSAVANSPLFTGPSNSKYLAYNVKALESKQYLVAGRLLAYSLVHCGQLPNFLAPPLYEYLTTGETDWPSEALPGCVQEAFLKAETAEGPLELQSALDPIMNIVEVAGCISFLRKKESMLGHLTNFLLVHRMKSTYDQFTKGLEELDVLDYMRKYPAQMRKGFIYEYIPLTAEMLLDVFGEISWSAEGSNARAKEAEIYSWFMDFLQDIEGEIQDGLEKLLQFATGSVSIPVLGFFIQSLVCYSKIKMSQMLP